MRLATAHEVLGSLAGQRSAKCSRFVSQYAGLLGRWPVKLTKPCLGMEGKMDKENAPVP